MKTTLLTMQTLQPIANHLLTKMLTWAGSGDYGNIRENRIVCGPPLLLLKKRDVINAYLVQQTKIAFLTFILRHGYFPRVSGSSPRPRGGCPCGSVRRLRLSYVYLYFGAL